MRNDRSICTNKKHAVDEWGMCPECDYKQEGTIKAKDISVYTTTQMYEGTTTSEKIVNQLKDNLIDEFYYGRRFDPENLKKLFDYTIQEVKKIYGKVKGGKPC